MQKTANEIKSEFELLASGHYQIHSFLYAQEFEQQAYENLIYPLMLVYPLGGSLSGTSYTRNYRVVIADRVLKSEGNELEVESDTQLIALDTLAYWMKLGTNERFSITSSNTITPFWEKWGDEVTGHFVDIGIEEFYDFNSCAIPLSTAIPSPTNPCKDARILINSVVYGNAPSDTNFNVVVKDQLGALVGSLIGGEWIVNTGGACADATYTIEDSLGNVLYTGTIPSGGSVTEVIGNSTLNVNKSDGTLISSRSILAEGTDSYNVGDSSAVLKDEDGNVLSTTPIKATETEDIVAPNGDVSVNSVAFDDVLSGGTLNIEVLKSTGNDLIGSKQGQYWRIGDSTAVIKDSANNTLKSEAIMATETENIIINDSSVENSDATYSVDVLAEGSLVLPDSQINVNSVDSGDVVSVKTIDVNLEDSLGAPVVPTSVGLVGNTLTIEVPSGGGSYDLDLVDRFGNAFPTKQVSANANWDLRTLTPFDYADIFLSRITTPSAAIIQAITELTDDLVAANLWDKIFDLRPLVYENNNQDVALNLKYPFLSESGGLGQIIGSPTINTNGVTTNGTNGIIFPCPIDSYGNGTEGALSVYSRTDGAGITVGSIDIGYSLALNSRRTSILIRGSLGDSLVNHRPNTNAAYASDVAYTGSALGLFSMIKDDLGQYKVTRNGILMTNYTYTQANAVAIKIRPIAYSVGGFFLNGSNAIQTGSNLGSARNYALACVHDFWNEATELSFYNIIQTFQTTLSRQV